MVTNIDGVREYALLSADFDLLPKYCKTGSTAICVDTGEMYIFHKATKTWYPL